MFELQTTPRVFALPLGANFSQGLVDGMLDRLKDQPPEALARVVIYVNTRRSARGIEELLSQTGARLLPDIRVITDLANELSVPLPRAIPPLRRRLIIAQLVAAYIESEPDVAPKSAVFDLADSLGALLDGFQGEGVAMAALNDVEVGAQSKHWERSLKFLGILSEYWSNHRPDNAPDPEERQRAVAKYYAEKWQSEPPEHPIIIAGSTGSRGATALFMDAVSNLPQGAVILPGYDYDMPQAALEKAAADHPQFGFGMLSENLGFPHNPPKWIDISAPQPTRNKLVSLAMRPAPVTDQWLREGPKLLPDLANACAKMTLVDAPTPRAEAEAIAIRLRQAAENGQKAALVSPDRILTRRVSSVLARWGITPDDSAGRPLPLTPPGVFLRRVIGLAGTPLTPENLLAILKHPLCGGAGDARSKHLQMTRFLEMEMLRGGAPFIDWDTLLAWANEERAAWITRMRTALTPLLSASAELPLADWLVLHRDAAESLSGENGPLWEKEAGDAALRAMASLEAEKAYGGPISAPQYRALFQSILNTGEVREEAFLPHPNIAILGTLEARVQSAELVILGGLNEGIWPSTPQPDPWMSRDMRRQIGLPLPERQIGLSAHDFQQAIAAKEVVLSRSVRDGEAPTVASRWMIRLLNLLDGLEPEGKLALVEMRTRGDELLLLADVMNRPDAPVAPAPRPSPSPPLAARPDQLSVTRIETLIRDPYAIYADKVLGLRALEPPGKNADARERGTALHKVLEVFLERTASGLPDNAETIFVQSAREVLADVPWPSTRQLWLARLTKIASWFVAGEHERRARATPLQTEVSGKRTIAGHAFTLTAKADRLDLLPDGSVAIYDYKSGGLPSAKQVKNFSVQLPLEGAIAQAGGFRDIAKTKISHLELIGLGSGGKSLKLDFEIDEVWGRLVELVTAFESPNLGYTARSRPEHISFDSDFDHLSRYGEWQDGDPFNTEAME